MVRVADVIREIRLRSLVAVFWFASVALPLLAQAPPTEDTFVVSARPDNNRRNFFAQRWCSPGSIGTEEYPSNGCERNPPSACTRDDEK